MSGEPARGYKWRPFERGHELSMRHGANSDRRVQPLADELAARLVDVRPDLADESYGPAVQAWSRAEARVELLTTWLDEVGLLDDDGEVRGAVRSLERAESTAARARERLGLDPRSDVELAILRAQASRSRSDLESVLDAGRRARELRGDAPRGLEAGS